MSAFVILCAAYRLDAVGDNVPADEGVAHAVGTIADAVADADGVEDEAYELGVPDALLDQLSQVVEVHITGIAVIAHADDADLRLLQISSVSRCRTTSPARGLR